MHCVMAPETEDEQERFHEHGMLLQLALLLNTCMNHEVIQRLFLPAQLAPGADCPFDPVPPDRFRDRDADERHAECAFISGIVVQWYKCWDHPGLPGKSPGRSLNNTEECENCFR